METEIFYDYKSVYISKSGDKNFIINRGKIIIICLIGVFITLICSILAVLSFSSIYHIPSSKYTTFSTQSNGKVIERGIFLTSPNSSKLFNVMVIYGSSLENIFHSDYIEFERHIDGYLFTDGSVNAYFQKNKISFINPTTYFNESIVQKILLDSSNISRFEFFSSLNISLKKKYWLILLNYRFKFIKTKLSPRSYGYTLLYDNILMFTNIPSSNRLIIYNPDSNSKYRNVNIENFDMNVLRNLMNLYHSSIQALKSNEEFKEISDNRSNRKNEIVSSYDPRSHIIPPSNPSSSSISNNSQSFRYQACVFFHGTGNKEVNVNNVKVYDYDKKYSNEPPEKYYFGDALDYMFPQCKHRLLLIYNSVYTRYYDDLTSSQVKDALNKAFHIYGICQGDDEYAPCIKIQDQVLFVSHSYGNVVVAWYINKVLKNIGIKSTKWILLAAPVAGSEATRYLKNTLCTTKIKKDLTLLFIAAEIYGYCIDNGSPEVSPSYASLEKEDTMAHNIYKLVQEYHSAAACGTSLDGSNEKIELELLLAEVATNLPHPNDGLVEYESCTYGYSEKFSETGKTNYYSTKVNHGMLTLRFEDASLHDPSQKPREWINRIYSEI